MTISEAYDLAVRQHQAGQWREAEAIYRQILVVDPRHALALHRLGILAHQVGRNDVAVEFLRQAAALAPLDAAIHSSLGDVFLKMGRLDEAIGACRRASEIRPESVEAHHHAAVALAMRGRLDEAAASFRRVLELQPDYAEAHNNLGNVWKDLGRLDEAIAAYRRALALIPGFAAAHNNLGDALFKQGRLDEAIAACRRAIEHQPDLPEAHHNLGNALKERGRPDEAVRAFRRALELQPASAEAQSNLGSVWKDLGRLDEAMTAYRRAVELQPGAGWAQSNLVYTALFHPAYDARAGRTEAAEWERRHGGARAQFIRPHGNRPEPERRLRIGYVSPDFWRHVTHHFLTPLLEAHDRAGFEIFCYASVPRPDAITARQRRSADVWREVAGLREEDLAELIRRDEIDLLVDLTQHMAGNRLAVFARKPAPVQVAWLGYPGTTGLSAIDYRLTDAQMEPEGAPWSESVEVPVRLPDSWFCFDPIEEYPAPGELPASRVGYVTFGCLNNFCKVNDAVLARWAGVLRAVPDSRLLLQCPEGSTQARVREFFVAHGIAAERVELLGKTATRAEFLALYARMDLALDPFPYNGGTTTCEALWMGVPVLTLPGQMIVSRIGLSILSAAGMREFVAETEEEYVRLAASLAGDLPRLAELRATLRERMKKSAFMDAPRFARNVEAAYRQMWRTWCGRQPNLVET